MKTAPYVSFRHCFSRMIRIYINMKKFLTKALSLILVLSMAAGLCSCGKKDQRQKYTAGIWGSFDTIISVIAYCDTEEEFSSIKTKAEELFLEYHRLFDIYNDYEGIVNIKTVNDNAGIAPVKVSEEILDLVEYGKTLYEETDGNVNIAFGCVLKIWHEARETAETNPGRAYVPDIDLLREASKHCNIDDVIVDRAASTVYLADPEMSLDVGAIAKGFATDLVVDKIKSDGNDCFLITAGTSSIRAVGSKPDGSSWTSAVETDPDANLIQISDRSITTSGIYQRYYEVDGVMYHHIINKDSLMPEHNYMSVTLITDECGYGDGLSTAVFNMELKDGLAFVESHENIYGMWVLLDGSVVYSDGFKDFIKAK